MTKMRLLTLALLLIAGLAATAQASHTESLVLNADCDGFNAEGVLVLSSYIGTGDMEVAVEALNDGVVVASGTATFHIESRIVEGNPFTFEGVWDVAPEGATEAVFLMTLHSQGWLSLNETHNLAMECIMDDCQVRRPAWWYRHPDAWPVDELEIGGCTLNKCQIRNLMTGCWGRRVAKRLFRHTVAAMLNDLACGGAPLTSWSRPTRSWVATLAIRT